MKIITSILVLFGIITSVNVFAQGNEKVFSKDAVTNVSAENIKKFISRNFSEDIYLVTDILYQDYSNGKWEDTGKDSCFYDSENNLVRTLELIRNSSKWINSRNNLRVYYDFNKEKTYKLQLWKNNSWADSFQILSFYNIDRLLDSTVYKNYISTWENDKKYIYNYYQTGQIQEERQQVWKYISWADTVLINYSYNPDSSSNEILYQIFGNNEWQNDSLISYYYNNQSKLTEELFQNWQNNSWVVRGRNIYQYDLNGNINESTNQSWENNAWINNSKTIYSYDNSGSNIEFTIQIWLFGSWINSFKFSFEYNSLDLLASLTVQYWNFISGWDNLLRAVYNYNKFTDISDQITIDNFHLYQNYPNPFNPVTNFEFRIADHGLVSLKVYDILGNEVANIVNEELPAGNYKYQWNATNLASGVYFYQLKAGSFVETKKLILLR